MEFEGPSADAPFSPSGHPGRGKSQSQADFPGSDHGVQTEIFTAVADKMTGHTEAIKSIETQLNNFLRGVAYCREDSLPCVGDIVPLPLRGGAMVLTCALDYMAGPANDKVLQVKILTVSDTHGGSLKEAIGNIKDEANRFLRTIPWDEEDIRPGAGGLVPLTFGDSRRILSYTIFYVARLENLIATSHWSPRRVDPRDDAGC